jgi:hypothetical protein
MAGEVSPSPSLDDLLPPETRRVMAKVMKEPISYGVRVLAAPGATRRLVVVLGEAHVKLGHAAALGKELTSAFELRGVETFQTKQVFAGRALSLLIRAPRLLLRALTFGLVKGSTIVDAKALASGHTVELERTPSVPLALHVGSFYLAAFFAVAFAHLGLLLAWAHLPAVLADLTGWLTRALFVFECHLAALVPAWLLRAHPWAWLLHPMVAILTVRDTLMADGTVRMLKDHPGPRAALVILGRAHLPGFERELVTRHGFVRVG